MSDPQGTKKVDGLEAQPSLGQALQRSLIAMGIAQIPSAPLNLVATTLIVPIALGYFGGKYLIHNPARRAPGVISLVMVLSLVSSALSYLRWGIESGMLLKPDVMTVVIAKEGAMAGVAITSAILVGSLIWTCFRRS